MSGWPLVQPRRSRGPPSTDAFRSGSSRNSFRLPGRGISSSYTPKPLLNPNSFFSTAEPMNARRVPSLLLENARQRMRGGLQNEAAGISHVVNVRVLPGEDAGVGRRRQRRLRHRVLEQNAALREAVQRRRFDVRDIRSSADDRRRSVSTVTTTTFSGRSRRNLVRRLGAAAGLEWQPASKSMPARHSHRRRGLARTHLVFNLAQKAKSRPRPCRRRAGL